MNYDFDEFQSFCNDLFDIRIGAGSPNEMVFNQSHSDYMFMIDVQPVRRFVQPVRKFVQPVRRVVQPVFIQNVSFDNWGKVSNTSKNRRPKKSATPLRKRERFVPQRVCCVLGCEGKSRKRTYHGLKCKHKFKCGYIESGRIHTCDKCYFRSRYAFIHRK